MCTEVRVIYFALINSSVLFCLCQYRNFFQDCINCKTLASVSLKLTYLLSYEALDDLLKS